MNLAPEEKILGAGMLSSTTRFWLVTSGEIDAAQIERVIEYLELVKKSVSETPST